MSQRISESEFHHVLALLRSMLVEAGLGAWEIDPWLEKTAARLVKNHQAGTSAYFVESIDGQPVAMAGALLGEHHRFLFLISERYGRVVDEYVLPEFRGRGLEQRLRAEAAAWIAQTNSVILTAAPPDVARLAASSGVGKL